MQDANCALLKTDILLHYPFLIVPLDRDVGMYAVYCYWIIPRKGQLGF